MTDHAEMTELEDMILTVTMMLSIVQMNDIKPLYSVIFDASEMPFQWIFYTNLRAAHNIEFFSMISDEYVPRGISSYLTQCYDEFDRLHKAFNLYPFLHSQLFAARTDETHFIMVVLIITLEYLVTHYGLNILGWKPANNQTLMSKLKRLNTKIKMIPDKYLDEKFQSNIRDPLMHMGIVQVSDDDLLSKCYDLHNLITMIYLKLVGYKGKYLAFEFPPRVLEMR